MQSSITVFPAPFNKRSLHAADRHQSFFAQRFCGDWPPLPLFLGSLPEGYIDGLLQVALGQFVDPDVSAGWKNVAVAIVSALQDIRSSAGEFQIFEPFGIKGRKLFLTIPEAIVQPSIGFCVCFALASPARSAAVKVFAGSVLLHMNFPAACFVIP